MLIGLRPIFKFRKIRGKSMTYFSELSSSSIEEVKTLINHFREIKIKDSLIADSLETSSSVLLSNKFFEVYYKRDSYPIHDEIKAIIKNYQVFTKYEILNYTENKLEVSNVLSDITESPITEEKIDFLVRTIRDKFLNGYEDLNPYYFNLQKQGVPIWISRFANEFDLIYEPSTTEPILSKFSDTYRRSKKYFLESLYNKSFVPDSTIGEGLSRKNTYHSFCRMTICLITLIDILNTRMKNPFDFDFLSENDIDQFLFSFGFTEFKDFPFKYKKRLVDCINRLIKKKGTDAIFVDIMSIFDFKGINLIRYHLLIDKVVLDGKGYPIVTKDPRFIGYDLNKFNEASDAIKENDYTEISYEDMTYDDPTWLATKEEVSNILESHVASKYFSLTTSIDLTKNSADTALLINLIGETSRKNPEKFNLYVHNRKISSSKISLVNAIIALQCMVCDYYGIEDRIVFSESGLQKIFSFNNTDSNEKFQSVYNENTKTMVLLGTDSVAELNDSTLSSLFNYNEKMKETVEDYLSKQQRTHLFTPDKMTLMKESYAAKFTADFNQKVYSGYTHYNEWLKDQDSELFEYVQRCFKETDDNKRELIIEIMDTLSDYCAATNIRFDSMFNTVVAQYVRRLIDVFKSYTVTLKDFKIYYTLDEKLFFALIEEVKTLGKILSSESFSLREKEAFISFLKLKELGLTSLLEKAFSKSSFNFSDYRLLVEAVKTLGIIFENEAISLSDKETLAGLLKLKELGLTSLLEKAFSKSSFNFSDIELLIDELKSRSEIFKDDKLINLGDFYELFQANLSKIDKVAIKTFLLLGSFFTKTETFAFQTERCSALTKKLVSSKIENTDKVNLMCTELDFLLTKNILLGEKVVIGLLADYVRTIKEEGLNRISDNTFLTSRLQSTVSGYIYDVPSCSIQLNKSSKVILTDSFTITVVNG